MSLFTLMILPRRLLAFSVEMGRLDGLVAEADLAAAFERATILSGRSFSGGLST